MLDVHAPHSRIEGFKDFLLHLLTITIGLLIALGLEGGVEWQYHRHLVRDANQALRAEIAQNIKTLESMRQPVADQRKQLDADLNALAIMRTHPNQKGQSLTFGFVTHSFDDTAWRTAQTTGAFAYMPYAEAGKYADAYGAQQQFVQSEHEVIEALLQAMADVQGKPDDWKPTPAEIDAVSDRIRMLNMRLFYLDIMMDSLDHAYSGI